MPNILEAPQGVYSLTDVHASVDGALINGYADGDDVISINRLIDKGNIQWGADGSGQVNIYQPDPYEVVFSLLAISRINDFFAGIFASYNTGRVRPINIAIRSMHGGFSFQGDHVLSTHGPITAGMNKGSYSWTFRSAKANMVPGSWGIVGNGNITGNPPQTLSS